MTLRRTAVAIRAVPLYVGCWDRFESAVRSLEGRRLFQKVWRLWRVVVAYTRIGQRSTKLKRRRTAVREAARQRMGGRTHPVVSR